MACQLLLIGHGTLPRDMLQTAEMIYGPAEGVSTICLPPDQDMEAYRASIEEKMACAGEEGLLILTDFMGGTPFLTASRAMREYWTKPIELVTGMNLPMLMEVLGNMDDATAGELAACAVETGAGGITDFRKAVAARHKEEKS